MCEVVSVPYTIEVDVDWNIRSFFVVVSFLQVVWQLETIVGSLLRSVTDTTVGVPIRWWYVMHEGRLEEVDESAGIGKGEVFSLQPAWLVFVLFLSQLKLLET